MICMCISFFNLTYYSRNDDGDIETVTTPMSAIGIVIVFISYLDLLFFSLVPSLTETYIFTHNQEDQCLVRTPLSTVISNNQWRLHKHTHFHSRATYKAERIMAVYGCDTYKWKSKFFAEKRNDKVVLSKLILAANISTRQHWYTQSFEMINFFMSTHLPLPLPFCVCVRVCKFSRCPTIFNLPFQSFSHSFVLQMAVSKKNLLNSSVIVVRKA